MTQQMEERLSQAEMLEGVTRIAERLFEAEAAEPVTPYCPPDELAKLIKPEISAGGMDSQGVFDLLERVVLATPRTGSRRFFNQLFSGRQPLAAAGEMLASLLNTSMYTYKVAGPHAIIETAITTHMADKVGYENGEGIFSPGGSLANMAALIIARNDAVVGSRENGLDARGVAVYASRECHYSIRKSCGMIGLGRRALRLVDVDEHGRMKPDVLASMIAADRQARTTPIAIVATAGTTVRGAFDPLEPIAKVAQANGIWLHVDGAFGGSALMTSKHRDLVAGSELADSWTWDAHKMMGVPLSSSVLLCKEPGTLEKNFNETATYLFQSDEDQYNHGIRSIQCGRRNDALKLWAAWKHLGDDGYTERMDHLFHLARFAADQIKERESMVLTCEPASVNVCFEVEGKPSDEICERLRTEQRAMVGFAEVNGRRIIRVALVNPDMNESDVSAFLDAVDEVGQALPAGDNQI